MNRNYAVKIFSCLVSFSCLLFIDHVLSESTLNITAITAENDASVLECWALQPPFSISSTPGIKGSQIVSLGTTGSNNITYSVTPPRSDGGLHNAPVPQYVLFLNGLAHVTLPTNSTSEAYILGGNLPSALIFANDLANLSTQGHRTTYPSGQETVALAFPPTDKATPEHNVLYDGPCQ